MRLGVLDIGSNAAQPQVVEVYPEALPLPTDAIKEPPLLVDQTETGREVGDAQP